VTWPERPNGLRFDFVGPAKVRNFESKGLCLDKTIRGGPAIVRATGSCTGDWELYGRLGVVRATGSCTRAGV